MPVIVESYVTAYQIAFEVTTQAGNYDVGIYDEAGTQLVAKGSTAVPVAGLATADITDTPLEPGTYFLAMSINNSDGRRLAAVDRHPRLDAPLAGVQDQDTAFVLPNPATFSTPGSTYYPAMAVAVGRRSDARLPARGGAAALRAHLHALVGRLGHPPFGSTIQAAVITWPVANTAFYVPVSLPFPYQVRRVFWVNGSTITSVSMDFGIYNATGTRLYSTGSTAQSAHQRSPVHGADGACCSRPAPTTSASAAPRRRPSRGGQGSTGATVLRCRLAGILQQASVATLPAAMTGASVANACVPLCGITRTASGFA